MESKKKKKSKKLKKEKDKSKGKPSLCLSYGEDHHSRKIKDVEKKRRKDKKLKKKKKSALQDKSALQPGDIPTQSKKVNPPHEVTDKRYTDHHPIQTQELGNMNKCVPKAMKYVGQDINLVKVRPKKRVLFDLSPMGSMVTKYSDAPRYCSNTTLIGTGKEHEANPPRFQAVKQCEESQGSTEYINSQDLFITQNTFLSPSLISGPSDEVTSTPEFKQTKSQQPFQELLATVAWKSTVETATQTENFFTSTELSTFLHFQLNTMNKCTEPPVDLSLPHRERGQKTTSIVREESDMHQRNKTDLTQLKVVQMRLNESFFFKMKGEKKESPKSQCPLMKLEEDYGKKHKK